MKYGKIIAAIFIILTAIALIQRQVKPTSYESGWDFDEFGAIPIQEGGRIKPMDTLARTTLMMVSGKQSLRLENGNKLNAIEWFAELTLDSNSASKRKVFRIDHPDVVGLLGFHNEERKYFSLEEIAPHFQTLNEQLAEVEEEPALRTPYESALVKLENAIRVYDQTAYILTPPPVFGNSNMTYNLVERAYADSINEEANSKDQTTAKNALQILREQFHRLSQTLGAQAIPKLREESPEWFNLGSSLLQSLNTGKINSIVQQYGDLSLAYRSDDKKEFSRISKAINEAIHSFDSDRVKKTNFEFFFNHLSPFYLSLELYVLAFLIAVASWMIWPKYLAKSGYYLLGLTFIIHTFGIFARIYIQERPPVTNLYSSAVFVGWAAVPICLYLEKRYLNGIAIAAVSLLSFCTLIVAHHLSFSGDTMEMMQAVLDSNFWLGTHVPTVTIGYSATFLAGFLGAFYLIREKLFRNLDSKTAKAIEGMVFGTICFALLFSFVGTVLGGIWADQSWGRFWGWDPKENGALMIVIWNAVILHARWAKIATPIGIMQLALVGNIITAWSWFGTNMLGVGLHSYGFTDSAFFWLCIFFLSQLIIIALGYLPSRKIKD